MIDQARGAQRASSPRRARSLLVALVAAVFAIGGVAGTAQPVAAAGPKVVIVVGPSHSATAKYIDAARKLAAQARSYGAQVIEIYSPNATYYQVRTKSVGARVLIYLGHGNGWPSPYAPFSVYRKDGMGLNASANNGNANVRYYGEYYMDRGLALDPQAVVILNRLCYASGNSEPGFANPTKSTAIQRVDNFGAGFLRSGAKIVFAQGVSSPGYVLKALFTGAESMTMQEVFWTDPTRTSTYKISFSSKRTVGAKALMDPASPGRYYRSVIGNLALTVGDWRN